MRGRILVFLVLIPALLSAKKAPKWKEKGFQTSASGIRYSIRKCGKGDSIRQGDYVNLWLYFYNSKTKKFAPNLSPSGDLMVNPKTGSVVQIPAEGYPGALENAIMMLKSGGEGYFIIPELFGFYRPDSGYCFIKIISVSKGLGTIIHPNVDSTRTDSINFVLPDPLAENFGDTLFTSAKLVEFPMISRCGDLRAMTDVFKFQLSWFDNGVQHKDILVYVDCPSDYGKDFFVEGKMYVITVIPLTDKAKGARTVYDQFPNDHLERYLLLQIK